MPHADDALATALRFLRETQSAVAERVTAVPSGSALQCERLPAALPPNCLIVHDPARRPDAAELIALADLMHGRLAQRRVIVEDEALGAALADGFRASRWQVERHAVMVLRTPPAEPAPAAGTKVGALAPAAAREIAARIDREALERDGHVDERLIEDQLAWLDAMRAVRNGRCFGSAGASACTLLSDGVTAQIEEVGTLPEARGRGLARATVQAAIDTARDEGHTLTFLVADADEGPRALYERLGFETVGSRHVFSRYLCRPTTAAHSVLGMR